MTDLTDLFGRGQGAERGLPQFAVQSERLDPFTANILAKAILGLNPEQLQPGFGEAQGGAGVRPMSLSAANPFAEGQSSLMAFNRGVLNDRPNVMREMVEAMASQTEFNPFLVR